MNYTNNPYDRTSTNEFSECYLLKTLGNIFYVGVMWPDRSSGLV